jgi:DNA/RNA-binding domain of Phe-tRNA-synthetase-like protein
VVGYLAMHNVANPAEHAGLELRKEELERELRSRHGDCDRAALRELPELRAYHVYYKRFKKTYHVQLQLESVVLKRKPLPRVASLVEAMFMAELDSLLLTAGHDLATVKPPVRIDVADGSERFVRMNGQEQALKPGDMMISDEQGVLSSVLYGPDLRSQIRPETKQVLFTVYGVPGIARQAVISHLEKIQSNVHLIAPSATVAAMEVQVA